MESDRLRKRNILFLLFLLLFCFPLGLLFLFWVIGGRKGLFAGIGCFAIPFLLFMLWLGGVWYANKNPEFGEHVAKVDWLPSEATDVSFYKAYSYTAYEFTIPEKIFRENANSSWNFQEITEPEIIYRYNYNIETESYRKKFPEYDHGAYTQLQRRITATVRNGIVAKYRQADGGGYHAVYDRDAGIAYIQTNPR